MAAGMWQSKKNPRNTVYVFGLHFDGRVHFIGDDGMDRFWAPEKFSATFAPEVK